MENEWEQDDFGCTSTYIPFVEYYILAYVGKDGRKLIATRHDMQSKEYIASPQWRIGGFNWSRKADPKTEGIHMYRRQP